MTMQRRHFELIAETIAQLSSLYMDEPITRKQQRAIAERFSNALYNTNPQFNRDRFLRACRVEG